MLIQCPECKQQISEQAASCPKCGRPVSDEDRERAQAEHKATAETNRKAMMAGGIVCLFLVLFGIVMGVIGGRETPGPRQARNYGAETSAPVARAAPSEAKKAKVAASAPNVGVADEGYLRLPDSDAEVVLAIDLKAYDEFVNVSVAKDMYGLADLVLARRIFKVASGTRGLVIETKWFKNRVRVLEGPEAGRSGWVPFEWVRSEPREK